MVGEDLGDRKCGFDSETNAAQQADIGAEVRDGGKVDDKKGSNEVAQEDPIPVEWGQSANIHYFGQMHVACCAGTYGLVLRHCQKLYGRRKPLLAPLKGECSTVSLGRLSKATFRRAAWVKIITTACASRAAE